MRIVVDTGVLVSGLIRRSSIPGEVIHALRDNRFCQIYTTPIMVEMIDVLSRPVFRDKYHIQPDDITALINLIRMRGELVVVERKIDICRDPKDNKFLEAALTGRADAIVSGDNDLISLLSFEGIPAYRPSEFLQFIFGNA